LTLRRPGKGFAEALEGDAAPRCERGPSRSPRKSLRSHRNVRSQRTYQREKPKSSFGGQRTNALPLSKQRITSSFGGKRLSSGQVYRKRYGVPRRVEVRCREPRWFHRSVSGYFLVVTFAVRPCRSAFSRFPHLACYSSPSSATIVRNILFFNIGSTAGRRYDYEALWTPGHSCS